MQSFPSIQSEGRSSGSHAPRTVARGLGVLWALISWPIIVVLALFEPFVRGILYGFAILGTLAALFLRYVGNRADVSLFTVFTISLGCLVAAGLYRGLLRLLASTINAGR
jgi:hypothetical protein